MLKKIGSLILVMTMFANLTVQAEEMTEPVVAEATTQEVIELSLEMATEKMLNDSAGAEAARINLLSAEAAAKGNNEKIDSIQESMKITGFLSTSLPSSYEEKLQIIVSEFAESQGALNYEAEMNKLYSEIREKYFSLQQLVAAVEIQQESLVIQEKSYNETKEKYALGLVTLNDLHASELSLIEAQNSLKQYNNNLQMAKMDMNNFLGYDLMQSIKLTDTLEALPMPVTAVEEATAVSLEKNNGIKAAEYNLRLQELQYTASGLRNSRKSSTYLNQEVAYLNAVEGVESAKAGIAIDAMNKYLTMMLNYDLIAQNEMAVSNAKERLDAAELSYELGLGTALQVQQARLGYTSQQMALSQAILDYNLSVDSYNLLLTPGTTTAPIQ